MTSPLYLQKKSDIYNRAVENKPSNISSSRMKDVVIVRKTYTWTDRTKLRAQKITICMWASNFQQRNQKHTMDKRNSLQ